MKLMLDSPARGPLDHCLNLYKGVLSPVNLPHLQCSIPTSLASSLPLETKSLVDNELSAEREDSGANSDATHD